MNQPQAGQIAKRTRPIVRYSMSADGIGSGSGGIGFDNFAAFYALRKGIVQPEGIDLQIVERSGGRPVLNKLLIDRDVDIGVISLATAVRKIHEGLNLRVLCRESRFEGGGKGGNSMFVRASSNIKSASDLASAKGIMFHCAPDSERLVVQRAILEKKFGLKWSALPLAEGA